MAKNEICVEIKSEVIEFKKPEGLTNMFNSWYFNLPRFSEPWFEIKNNHGSEIIRKSDELIITYLKGEVYFETLHGNKYGPLNRKQIIELMKIIK